MKLPQYYKHHSHLVRLCELYICGSISINIFRSQNVQSTPSIESIRVMIPFIARKQPNILRRMDSFAVATAALCYRSSMISAHTKRHTNNDRTQRSYPHTKMLLMLFAAAIAFVADVAVSVVVHAPQPQHRYDRPVPGSTLRCLDDPIYDANAGGSPIQSSSVPAARTMAADVLEKARDRFDRFWGGTKEENV